MEKREYVRAVRKAWRIFAAVYPVEGCGPVQVRISKAKARALVARFEEHETIKAEWLEGAERVLMVA